MHGKQVPWRVNIGWSKITARNHATGRSVPDLGMDTQTSFPTQVRCSVLRNAKDLRMLLGNGRTKVPSPTSADSRGCIVLPHPNQQGHRFSKHNNRFES